MQEIEIDAISTDLTATRHRWLPSLRSSMVMHHYLLIGRLRAIETWISEIPQFLTALHQETSLSGSLYYTIATHGNSDQAVLVHARPRVS